MSYRLTQAGQPALPAICQLHSVLPTPHQIYLHGRLENRIRDFSAFGLFYEQMSYHTTSNLFLWKARESNWGCWNIMSAVQADELLLAPHQIYSYGQLDMARESNWGCAIIKSAVRTDGLLHYPSSNVFVWMTRESYWGCLIIWPTQYLISRGQSDF